MGEQLLPHLQFMSQEKFVYSVAIRHQDNTKNLYHIELSDEMPADQMSTWVTRLRDEVPGTHVALCAVSPLAAQQPTT